MARTGRPRGKTDTRNAILAAARERFSANGFDKTSVREVAAVAGVDAAMIRHYFGSKADLFRATMGWPFQPAELASRILDGDRSGLGERLTTVFLQMWEAPETQAPLMAILRGAATHQQSTALVRQFLEHVIYPHLAAGLPEPDAELRINLAISHLLGIAYLRHILNVEPLATTPVEELIARVAPVVSHHLIAK